MTHPIDDPEQPAIVEEARDHESCFGMRTELGAGCEELPAEDLGLVEGQGRDPIICAGVLQKDASMPGLDAEVFGGLHGVSF